MVRYHPGQGTKGLGGQTVKIPTPLLASIKELVNILRAQHYGADFVQDNPEIPKISSNLIEYRTQIPAHLKQPLDNLLEVLIDKV